MKNKKVTINRLKEIIRAYESGLKYSPYNLYLIDKEFFLEVIPSEKTHDAFCESEDKE